MNDTELLIQAYENTGQAHAALHGIHDLGLHAPVPAAHFTAAMLKLRTALCALTELERRARGGEMPKQG